MSGGVRVIKLGGSLLDWQELPEKFDAWLAAQPAATNVVIVGGGALVDVVRDWDRTHRLPSSTAHWLAIRAMSVTAELAAALLSGATLIHDVASLDLSGARALQVLDVYPLLRGDTTHALPHGWHVTSDSIAAHMARRCSASELVLLKSTAAADDLVDSHFPVASQGLNVRIVNLRNVAGTLRVP